MWPEEHLTKTECDFILSLSRQKDDVVAKICEAVCRSEAAVRKVIRCGNIPETKRPIRPVAQIVPLAHKSNGPMFLKDRR